jgi:hypothetical protein
VIDVTQEAQDRPIGGSFLRDRPEAASEGLGSVTEEAWRIGAPKQLVAQDDAAG